MIIILALLGWMPMARIVRGEFLSLREKEYVEAARARRRVGAADHPAPPAARTPSARSSCSPRSRSASRSSTEADAVVPRRRHPAPRRVARQPDLRRARSTVGTDLAYLIIFPGLVLFLVVLARELRRRRPARRARPASRPVTTLADRPGGPTGRRATRRCSRSSDLRVEFATDDGAREGRRRRVASPCRRGRRSRSSGSRARARASPRCRSWAWSRSRAASPAATSASRAGRSSRCRRTTTASCGAATSR